MYVRTLPPIGGFVFAAALRLVAPLVVLLEDLISGDGPTCVCTYVHMYKHSYVSIDVNRSQNYAYVRNT